MTKRWRISYFTGVLNVLVGPSEDEYLTFISPHHAYADQVFDATF